MERERPAEDNTVYLTLFEEAYSSLLLRELMELYRWGQKSEGMNPDLKVSSYKVQAREF